MLDRLMRQAEQAEVFEIDSEATKVGFEANRMKSFEVEESRGVAVRVIADGRLGFAASSDLTATDKLVANALESARYGDALPMRFPADQEGPAVRVYDEALASMPTQRLVDMGKEIIAVITDADGDAQVNVDIDRRVRRTRVLNSAGQDARVTKSPLSLQVVVERVRGDDVLILFEYFSTATADDGYRAAATSIAAKLRLANRMASIGSGRMPVLFAPSGMPVLGVPLMMGLNGKNVYRGISPLAGKVGERLFDEKLTIVDDPTIDGRPGSSAYDDEGVVRRRRALVQNGVLEGFVYDLRTAAQAGTESTGSGERSLFSPPSPSPANLVVEGGGTPLAEMIAGIKLGLLVEDPLGLGQGNVISGAFSNPLSLAFRIENGEIVGRVKDVSIAGNVYQDLRRIDAISDEAEWVYGGMRMPYVLLPELSVASKGG